MLNIPLNDAETVTSILRHVNGKSTRHTYNRAEELVDLAAWGEAKLAALGLPPSLRAGAQVVSVSGLAIPNAYKYQRRVTGVTLTRRKGGWKLTCALSFLTWRKTEKPPQLYITKKQDKEAVYRLRKRYDILSD